MYQRFVDLGVGVGVISSVMYLTPDLDIYTSYSSSIVHRSVLDTLSGTLKLPEISGVCDQQLEGCYFKVSLFIHTLYGFVFVPFWFCLLVAWKLPLCCPPYM